jgi:hypothetical protein
VFAVDSSISARCTKETGDCGSGVIIAKEVDEVEDIGSGGTIMIDFRTTLGGLFRRLPDLESVSLNFQVSEFLEYQHPD